MKNVKAKLCALCIVTAMGCAADSGNAPYDPLGNTDQGPAPVGADGGVTPDSSKPASGAGLDFVADPGLRMDNASNAHITYDAASGKYYLFYKVHGEHQNMVADSVDGLEFSEPRMATPQDEALHPAIKKMPQNDAQGNAIYRKFLFDMESEVFRSKSSSDKMNFTDDDGVRYDLHSSDNGKIGYHDFFINSSGHIMLAYLGDAGGTNNNLRLARSTDNGWTFSWVKGNLVGDDNIGCPGGIQWDPKTVELSDGRIRMFTMNQHCEPPIPGKRATGTVYSFISDDGGENFSAEGQRFIHSDVTEFEVYSLNDPSVIRLPDGRYRMYVTAMIYDTETQTPRQAIISATAE